MAQMARPSSPQSFPAVAHPQLWWPLLSPGLGLRIIFRNRQPLKVGVNLREVGLLSWEQFPARLRSISCQLVTPSASEGKIPSIPKRDFGSTQQGPLWLRSVRLTTDLSITTMEVKNSGIIPQKCWKNNCQIFLYPFIMSHEWMWNKNIFRQKQEKKEKQRIFPQQLRQLILKNVFLAKRKWSEMKTKRREGQRTNVSNMWVNLNEHWLYKT